MYTNMEKQTSLQKNNLDQIPKMSVYVLLRRKMLFELEDGSS